MHAPERLIVMIMAVSREKGINEDSNAIFKSLVLLSPSGIKKTRFCMRITRYIYRRIWKIVEDTSMQYKGLIG